MTLAGLEKLCRLHDKRRLCVRGSRGLLTAWLDGSRHPETGEPTYWVDVRYAECAGRAMRQRRQSGYRLSTVFCICAWLCCEDERRYPSLLQRVNSWFE